MIDEMATHVQSILTTHRCARIHFKRSVIKGKYKDMEEIYI